MSWTKDDVRDEMDEQEEEEILWIDKNGKVVEGAFCAWFLQKHPLMCLDQKLFDLDGEVNEERLRHEIHQEIRSAARNDTAKKTKRIVEAIKMETYHEEWDIQLDRIHLKNGTYYLDERGFVPEKELCLNRFPVEYLPDAPAPGTWLDFLNGLLMPEDIPTLQEYLGYLLIPSTKAQKMMILTGRGGEGKSRIGLVIKKLMGDSVQMESIHRLETNRFASANLEHKLVMVDDDLQMTALPDTRNVKSIVTAEDKTCIERKGKQATQGRLYVRLLCFGNGNLIAVNDSSDGFWRRQILISVKDRDPDRVDDPFLIDKMAAGDFPLGAGGSQAASGQPVPLHSQRANPEESGGRHGGRKQPGPVHDLGQVSPVFRRGSGPVHPSVLRLFQMVRGEPGNACLSETVQSVSFQERGQIWPYLLQTHRGRVPGL